MTAVVTGAAGHAGASLIRELAARGEPLRMLVRSDRRAVAGVSGETLTADLFDREALASAFDGADVVFHLAAQVSVDGDRDGSVRRTNVEGTRRVVEAALMAGVRRLVHFSTVHVYEPFPHDAPLDETRPYVSGGSAYDVSKIESEMVAFDAMPRGLEVVCVNPTGVIGPWDFKPSRLGKILWGLYRGTLPAVVQGGFDFVDARDVARAAVVAATEGQNGERYIVGGRYRTLRELAGMVRELSGRRRVSRVELPLWLARSFAEPSARVVRRLGRVPSLTDESLDVLAHGHPGISHRKAREALGHRPRPLEETVRDTLDWFEAQRTPTRAARGRGRGL